MSFDFIHRGVRPFGPSLALAILVLAALVPGGAALGEQASMPLVVKIHADWCGTCTRMEPSWSRASSSLGQEARFVVLDVTDADNLGRASAEAERLGIVDFFDAHKSKTGTVGILDASGKPVLVFKGELDDDAVRAALEEARGA